jgi:hypothetical protein
MGMEAITDTEALADTMDWESMASIRGENSRRQISNSF